MNSFLKFKKLLNNNEFFVLLIFLIFNTNLKAQDSIQVKKHKRYVVGFVPIIAYDADLGVRYGGVVNLFDKGKIQSDLEYNQYLFLRVVNTSKGTFQSHIVFDSETLIPKTKLLSEVTYMNDNLMDFFGFNGVETNFDNSFVDENNDFFIHHHFYSCKRQWLRARIDFQPYIKSRKLRMLFGYSFHWFDYKSVEQNSLYNYFKDWKILSANELSGGYVNQLTAGGIYEMRDSQINPKKGIWAESFVTLGYASNHEPFSKWIFTYRHYFSLSKSTVLAARFSSQQKLFGYIPFYFMSVYQDSRMQQDGLGGAFTLRGIARNRVVADGYCLANIELKKKIFDKKILKLPIEIDLALTSDLAMITQKRKIDYSVIPSDELTKHFNTDAPLLYKSIGLGTYIIINKGSLITVNYAHSLHKNWGGGFYVGSNLLF